MFCPICGSTDIKKIPKSSNGGNLFVAEDVFDSTEYYDSIAECICEKSHIFYVSLGYDNGESFEGKDLEIKEMIDRLDEYIRKDKKEVE